MPDKPPLKLDDYLPYLINRAGAHLVARFGAVLRREGIGIQDWRVLACLRERDSQRLTELAEHTAIEVSTLSRVIGTMETAGLVSRTRDAVDARAVTIRLLPPGQALAAKLTPTAAGLESIALAGFSAAESAQLKILLRRAYANLQAVPTLAAQAVSETSAARPRRGNGRKTG